MGEKRITNYLHNMNSNKAHKFEKAPQSGRLGVRILAATDLNRK